MKKLNQDGYITIEKGTSNITFAIWMIVGAVLIVGAFLSANGEHNLEAKKAEQQGCSYYKDYVLKDIPAKCIKYYTTETVKATQ